MMLCVVKHAAILPAGVGSLFVARFHRGHGHDDEDHHHPPTADDLDYEKLKRRFDHHPYGAVINSPSLDHILKTVFTPEEASVAKRMPSRPTPLDKLAKKLHRKEAELEALLTRMASKGQIVDLQVNDKYYYSSPPVVPGFFEFLFMRAKGKPIKLEPLLKSFDDYFHNEGDGFARKFFAGETQGFRTMIHEDAIPDASYTQVLDYEKASSVVERAGRWAVSECVCRTLAKRVGRGCSRPTDTCMTFGREAVEILTRHGRAREISKEEARDILVKSRESGLMQTADNVQDHVQFVCNCCGDCCTILSPMKKFDMRGGIVSSNFIVSIGDVSRCEGCGRCAKACPPGALVVKEEVGHVEVVEKACLGCGVCVRQCPEKILSMKPRAARVHTPENHFELNIRMAIERGKLHQLFFDDPELISHRVLGRIFRVIERSPPFQAAMAIKPFRSAFLDRLVKEAKKAMPFKVE